MAKRRDPDEIDLAGQVSTMVSHEERLAMFEMMRASGLPTEGLLIRQALYFFGQHLQCDIHPRLFKISYPKSSEKGRRS